MKNISDRISRNEIFKPWSGLLISFLCVLLLQLFVSFQPFDDAFITYRYARNISRGFGFVYNQGENVLGTTTPFFTLLLSLIAFITRPEYIPKASYFISIVADAVNVWLIFLLGKAIFKNKWIALLSSAVFLLQPFRINVSNGGMETSLFITSLLFTYYQYVLGERSLLTSFGAALTFLIRPDAVLALLPIYVDWFFHDWRTSLKAGLLTLFLVSPWLIWSTHYFGSPIPQSVLAKNITYKNPPGQALFFLFTFLGTGTQGPYSSPLVLLPIILFGLPVLTIGPGILVKHKSKGLTIALYPILYTVVMSIVNPSMIFSWYFVPLIPGILILIMGMIWYGLNVEKQTKLIISTVLSLMLILVPAYLLHQEPSSLISRAREESFWNACNQILDQDLEGKSVLAPDIGVIGWCLEDARILDPIGLVSPETLPYQEDLPSNQLVSLDLIIDQEPDYIVALDHFISPDFFDRVDLDKPYEIIYEENVLIAGDIHMIYIFQRDN